ncbi:LysR family transcriptional regulator [Sulfitobacter porphyrae]|nr:LysR family transcriptional regulator [Sulfitobacter porphyrae]
MKIDQIRAIVAVADNLSFSLAAENMQMTASKVSRLIVDAETHFGHPLFHRTTRRVELTQQGRNFVRTARRILALYDGAKGEADAIRRGKAGRIRLGYSGNVASDILPRIVKMCHETLPNVELGTTFAWSQSNMVQVQYGNLDVALISDRAPHPQLASLCLAQKKLYLICGADSALAGRGEVSFTDLEQEAFVVGPMEKWRVPREILLEYFGRFGATPRIAVEADDLMSMEAMVSAGVGIGLSYTEPDVALAHNLVRLPIVDLEDQIPVYLQWVDKGLQPVVRSFIEEAIAHFGIEAPVAWRRRSSSA